MSKSIYLIGDRYEQRKMFNEVNFELSLYGISEYKYSYKPSLKNILLPSLSWNSRDVSYLRGMAIKTREGLDFGIDDVYDDPEIQDQLFIEHRNKGESHLICHSFIFGYFVPIDFKDVTLPTSVLYSLGSSINIRNELSEIAFKMNFHLENYIAFNFIIPNEKRVGILNDEDDLLAYEKTLILELYNMALASIEYDLIINISG